MRCTRERARLTALRSPAPRPRGSAAVRRRQSLEELRDVRLELGPGEGPPEQALELARSL